MTLPPLPKDRDWSEATWRAGWDEACKRSGCLGLVHTLTQSEIELVTEHATTLLDVGIVKPVVSEAAMLLEAAHEARKGTIDMLPIWQCPAAIAVIQSALDKARAGE